MNWGSLRVEIRNYVRKACSMQRTYASKGHCHACLVNLHCVMLHHHGEPYCSGDCGRTLSAAEQAEVVSIIRQERERA